MAQPEGERPSPPTLAGRCGLCGRPVSIGRGYVVRIEVFADPEMPPMTQAEIASQDFDATLNDLLNQMNGMTAEELHDGVHRALAYRLCASCHREYLANPLGKPRRVGIGRN